MPASSASSLARQLTFPSAHALFKAANAMRLRDPAQRDSPVIQNGGIYLVKGRAVKLDILYRDEGRVPLVALVRTDWASLSRCRRWMATVGSWLGIDMGARTQASAKQARRIVKLQASIALDRQPYIQNQRSLLANIRTCRVARMQTALLEKELCASLAREFAADVRNAAYSLWNLYDAGLADADELAAGLLAPIRTALNARVAACRTEGLSEVTTAAVVDLIAKESPPARMLADKVFPPGAPASLTAARVLTTITGALTLKNTATVFRLDHDLGCVPLLQTDLPHFQEAALGDLHGNCLLLLHSLVKLGFFSVTNATAWQEMAAQLDSLSGLHGEPNDNYRAFSERLQAALAPAAVLPRKLVLLGSLFSSPMHNDMFMLAIVDRLHRAGVDFDILFSDDDSAFIGYCLDNRGQRHYIDRYGTPGNPRENAVAGTRDAWQAGPPNGRATTGLQRLHELVKGQNMRAQRDDLFRMFDEAYLPHLKLIASSQDGATCYSHAFVHRELFTRLRRSADVDPDKPVHRQIADINAWFQSKVLGSAAAFAQYADRTGDAPVREVASNPGWTFGKAASSPNTRGVDLPHVAFVRAVHGHTEDIEGYIDRHTGTPLQQGLIRSILAREPDRLAHTPQHDRFLSLLDDSSPALFNVCAARFIVQMLGAVLAQADTAAAGHAARLMAACRPVMGSNPYENLPCIREALTAVWQDISRTEDVPAFTDAMLGQLVREIHAGNANADLLRADWQDMRDAFAKLVSAPTEGINQRLSEQHMGLIDADRHGVFLREQLKAWTSLAGHAGAAPEDLTFSRSAYLC